MSDEKFYEDISNSIRQSKRTNTPLSVFNEILVYFDHLFLFYGNIEELEFNAFLGEAKHLLKNSIHLYENGYIDCAFYSVRQADELMNNMLYFCESKSDEFFKWSAKERFPTNKKIMEKLEQISNNYVEVRSLLPEYFETYEKLRNKAQKIIHKQGFDTFRFNLITRSELDPNFSQKQLNFFLWYLKYTIGMIIIIYVTIEPLSLALADESIDTARLPEFLTESIDLYYFKDHLELDNIFDQIMESSFFKKFKAGLQEMITRKT